LHIDTLFHWSPAERREDILKTGLQVYSPSVVHSGEYRWPYICLGTTPSSAWGLSGDMEWASEIEQWDLWQVRIEEGDEITIRGDFCPVIREVRVRNSLPPDRVWFVATRKPLVALEQSKPAKSSTKKKSGRKR
jgi:hypothetical protein